jgi:hypothetical protein
MARRVLYIAVALLLVGLLYVGYTSYDAGRSISNGEVYSNDPPSGRFTKRSSAPAPNTDSNAGQAVTYPAPAQAADSAVPVNSTAQVGQPGVASSVAAQPGTDSISPQPPNGMVFSGTGKYQLYRQGDITWRLDTDNGHTCIIFATDEEWKKPRVFRAGCGKT